MVGDGEAGERECVQRLVLADSHEQLRRHPRDDDAQLIGIGKTFDLFIVDGRARPRIAIVLRLLVHGQDLVIHLFDDEQRHRRRG